MNQPGAIYDSPPQNPPAASRHSRAASARSLARSWLDASLEFLFPSRCAGCLRVDTPWCDSCQTQLDALPFPPQQPFARQRFAALAASGPHTGLLRQALLALKYGNAQQLAEPLGARLAELLALLAWQVDLLLPVPLHPERERERGYNQAQLLADALGARLGIPLQPAALRRVVATRAQVGLDQQQRRRNVHAAFAADSRLVHGQHLLLVDDVYTTGATLEACAQALQDSGALSIHGLTLTRATSLEEHAEGATQWT